MSNLHLSPWSRMSLAPDEQDGLEARAVALGAHVNATHSRGGWTVHATNSSIRAAVYHAKGGLAPAIRGALEDFAAQQDIVDEEVADLFTAGELVQIQAQSRVAS